MVEYNIEPHKGIGPIKIGMTREQSRKAIGLKPKPFRKSASDKIPTDAYYQNSLQVFFDDNKHVEYIEVSGPGPIRVLYKGIDFFSLKADEAIALISKDAPYDPNDPELGYSYVFPALELSIWRPVLPDPEDDEDNTSTDQGFSTIGIGRPGYYSED